MQVDQSAASEGAFGAVDPLLLEIGYFVLFWGGLEGSIDIIIRSIHINADLVHPQKAVPTKISEKIAYLVAAAEVNAADPSVAASFREAGAELSDMVGFRHRLMHGRPEVVDSGDMSVRFSRLTPRDPVSLLRDEYTLTIEDVRGYNVLVWDMSRRLFAYIAQITLAPASMPALL